MSENINFFTSADPTAVVVLCKFKFQENEFSFEFY